MVNRPNEKAEAREDRQSNGRVEVRWPLNESGLEVGLLALISHGPRYGRGLILQLWEAGVAVAPAGTVYPVLRRMKGGGLLTVRLREGPAGPARKYYALAPAGRERLGLLGPAFARHAEAAGVIVRAAAPGRASGSASRPTPGAGCGPWGSG